jgi:hypothetical protein
MAEAARRHSRSHPIDPFRRSLMGRPFWTRFTAVALGLGLFWLAVAWAVAVP